MLHLACFHSVVVAGWELAEQIQSGEWVQAVETPGALVPDHLVF
jgi:hypothetical protein